jgi:hypothetical protein
MRCRPASWFVGLCLLFPLTNAVVADEVTTAELKSAIGTQLEDDVFALCVCDLPNCPACAARKQEAECKPPGRKPPAKPSPCASSHGDPFYNNKFDYLTSPDYSGSCLGDSLKLLPIGDCGRFGTMDIGGQFRSRFHHEYGMGETPGFTRFQGDTQNFLLSRFRLYNNWQMNDWARFYVEGIYAGVTADDSYVHRPIDVNFGDITNLFFDISLTDRTTVRVGRQELLYGAQRLVSTLDWANTRRTFEGINVLHRTENWALDAFYTNFVPVRPNDLDRADYDESFYGFYSVYSGFENLTIDTYYLGYDDERTGAPIVTHFSLHTLGVRLNGKARNGWLYEVEGGPQFGEQMGLGLDHSAGFVTAGVGRKIKSVPWDATFWFYYDYASGNAPGGSFNRFNHLFPLAHKYLGFIDAVQRSNIQSPNFLFTFKPAPKVTCLFWLHHFFSDQYADPVPSVGRTPAQSPDSRKFGDEIDLLLTYAVSPRTSVQVGYSHFFTGAKIVAPNVSDADFFYTQWQTNF